jgi:chemotaxis protein CheD
MKVSICPEDLLVTHSLGSCIGLTLYDPVAKIGGMVHCMLPLASQDKTGKSTDPCVFTDVGVSRLLQGVFDRGAVRKRLIAKVAGGANLQDSMGTFKIGERNYTVLRKLLWKNSILISQQDVGGAIARTMTLEMATGKTFIRSGAQSFEL